MEYLHAFCSLNMFIALTTAITKKGAISKMWFRSFILWAIINFLVIIFTVGKEIL